MRVVESKTDQSWADAQWLGTLLGVDLIFDGIWMLLPHSAQRSLIDQQRSTTRSKA